MKALNSMKNLFSESLISVSCHKNYTQKLKPYSKFIGSWNFIWTGFKDDGSSWSVPGEWHFSWVLEGRAIQDNWICPKIGERKSNKYPDGEYGTTIRYYDCNEENLKVIWIGPILSNLSIFEVKEENDEIIQNEILISPKTKISRWKFKDIKNNSFIWEAAESVDNGDSWKTTQLVEAKSL